MTSTKVVLEAAEFIDEGANALYQSSTCNGEFDTDDDRRQYIGEKCLVNELRELHAELLDAAKTIAEGAEFLDVMSARKPAARQIQEDYAPLAKAQVDKLYDLAEKLAPKCDRVQDNQ